MKSREYRENKLNWNNSQISQQLIDLKLRHNVLIEEFYSIRNPY